MSVAEPGPSFASLPAPAQTVLAALAITPAGVSRKALLAVAQACKLAIDGGPPDDTRLKALLTDLRKLGWLTPDTGHTRQPAQLRADLRNLVLCRLAQRPDLAQWVQPLIQQLSLSWDWSASARGHHEPRAWLALLLGQVGDAVEHIHSLMAATVAEEVSTTHPIPLLLMDTPGQAWFDTWPAPTQAWLLDNWLQLATYFLSDATSTDAAWQRGRALCLDHTPTLAPELRRVLGQRLLLQALLRGEFATLQTLGETIPDLQPLADFLLALTHNRQNRCADALAAMDVWQALERKRTGKRKITLHRPLQVLHWLAQAGSQQPAAIAALHKTLSADKDRYSGTLLLQTFTAMLQGRRMPLTEVQQALMMQRAPPYEFNALIAALAAYWLAPESAEGLHVLQDERARWRKAGYPWLAAEYDALLAQHDMGDAALTHWYAERDRQPLLALYQPQAPWQHALTALAQLRDAPMVKTAATSTAQDRRLAWLVGEGDDGNISVEPREQKRNARGQWSRGRAVALQRLREKPEDFDYLSEADRAVVATIRQSYVDYYYGAPRWTIPAARALAHLVGHPYLYRLDAPDVRIDLAAGQASLSVTEHNGQIRLRLHPERLTTQPKGLLQQDTPTQFTFYPGNPDWLRVAQIIGSGLAVPASAREQLAEAITAIAPMLPVHADVPELSAHLETLEGDATLYAHLLPLAEGLRLQLLVRPQADGSWLRPGQGAANLACEQDGKPVQIHRDLAGERARLQAVLDHCPTLADGAGDGHEWRFDNAHDALQLLTELHALDEGKVQCVWPEGERMRIRARPGLGQMRLSVQRQGDWFALQGEVELDDGRVLHIKQLLDLLRDSEDSRFVPLGEGDWLALSTDLRRRLADVALLADKVDEKGARLSTLAAPLLEALSEEAGEFNADNAWQEQVKRLHSLRAFTPKVPRLLQAQLRDYQREGFTWLARLAEWGVGACLADDMGLGKTVQLLALLLHRASKGPQLVVAPTSVVGNWQAEALRFAPSLRLMDYRQTRSLQDLKAGDLVLCSYGLLQSEQAAFAAQPWASVVLDEAQAVKNAQTKRSQAVMVLNADFRVIASGTPLENHLGELWNLMRFINPGLLGSQQRFSGRFAQPIELGDEGAKKQAKRALKQLIQPFILRRLKSEVLDELPPITEITHKIPLSDEERHQYEALRLQAVEALSNSHSTGGDARFKALAQITRLRRFCCHPSLVLPTTRSDSSKLQALLPILDELRENGHRALVFSQFVDHLSIVRKRLDDAGIRYQYLDGATPPKARTEAVNAFQAGDGEVFLISLKAGGSGLNLTAADYVIHLDPWWNPAVEDQAAGRAHRIGQQRPVTVYRLVCEATIEEQIVALHAHKRDLADSLLEGGELSARLDAEALLALLRQG